MGDVRGDRRQSAEDRPSLRKRAAELEEANRSLNERLADLERERKELEERLASSQFLAATVLDALPDPTVTMDLDGRIQVANREFRVRRGMERHQVVGKTAVELGVLDLDQWTRIRDDVIPRLMEEGTISSIEVTGLHPDGSPFPALLSLSVVKGPSGEPIGIICSGRDISPIKEAQRLACDRQQMLEGLFNAITESVLLTDAEGTLLALNETAARRLGRPASELIGRKFLESSPDLIPPDVAKERMGWIRQVIRSGKALRVTAERNGLTFDASLYPVLDDNGSVQRVAVFDKDITERKKAEGAVRDLQRQIEFILGAAKTGLDVIDKDFNLRYVDPTWQQVYGPFEAKKCYRYFMGRDGPCPGCAIPTALERRQTVVSDAVLVKENDRPIQVTTIPFQAENGEWLVAEVNVDISERQRLERRLRENEEKYRTVVEGAGEAIAIVNEQGVFQFMNGTAGRALGGAASEFIGKTMWDLFPREIADRQMSAVRDVIRTTVGANTVMPSRVRGELRWYNTTVEPLRDSTGQATAALVIARDIHELRTAQQELEAYRERIIRAEQLASLGTLSAMLAHELTQPLTVIRLSIQNALEGLEEVPYSSTVPEDLNDGLGEIANVMAIVKRFRRFAHRTSEKITRKVVLPSAVKKVMRLLEESAEKARVTLEMHALDGLPAIEAHEKDVEQILFALAENAIQAADGTRDRYFRVSGTARDDSVELQFADDCGGISPENLDHIFEPFFTTKSPEEGTGLGLCIVQRIVSQAGGRLHVDSRWNEGAIFTIALPIESK